MDIEAILTAITTAAALKAKDVAGSAVVDAYAAVKRVIADKYCAANATATLEHAPQDEAAARELGDALSAEHASTDAALLQAIRALTEALASTPPATLTAAAIDIQRVRALGLSVADVSASGENTTLRVADSSFRENLELHNIRIGGPANPK